jgi:hypothetical protein
MSTTAQKIEAQRQAILRDGKRTDNLITAGELAQLLAVKDAFDRVTAMLETDAVVGRESRHATK